MTITPPPSYPTVNPTPVPRRRVDPSPSPRRKAAAVHSIRRASRKGRLWVAAVGLLALTSGAAACGATSRAAPAVTGSPRPELSVGPAGAAFYQPPATLPPGPHGTLIWERPFHGSAALSGATNTLLLYTQVGIGGHLVATSGYVAIPHGTPPAGGWPVITWGHGTTGIADQCAPTIAANLRDTATNDPLLEKWITDGYAVVRTDYEGLGTPGPHPYLIGPSEGRAMLDIVEAARQFAPALSDRVLIAGHSQGGQAALWAASLAHGYTPDLRVGGTVAFAPAGHLTTILNLIRSVSRPGKAGTIALALRGAQIADPSLDVSSLLTPAARKLWPQTLTTCSAGLNSTSSFGGLSLDQLLNPAANITALDNELAANEPDHPKIPDPVLIE